jgi:hypothetical protein
VLHSSITHGLLDPLARMGFEVSAGIELADGRKLFAIFEQRTRRIMLVAHPARTGDMTAIALAPWTAARPPLAGDLLDELIDPRNVEAIRTALELLRNGGL